MEPKGKGKLERFEITKRPFWERWWDSIWRIKINTRMVNFYAAQLKKILGRSRWTKKLSTGIKTKPIPAPLSLKEKFIKLANEKSDNPNELYNFAQDFLQREILLAEHFKDRSIRHIKEFPKTGEKASGLSGGYRAPEHIIKTMIRPPQPTGATPSKLTPEQEYMNEVVIGPLYRQILHEKAPMIGIVTNEPIPLWSDTPQKKSRVYKSPYLSSKLLLPDFHTLSEFTESQESSWLGGKTEDLKYIEGVERVFAACLILADPDFHAGNVGIIGTKKTQMTLVKIDQGWASTVFYTNPETLLDIFANNYSDRGYQGPLPLQAKKLQEALTSMITLLSDELIKSFVDRRIEALRQNTGFNIQNLKFVYLKDGIKQPTKTFNTFDEIKDHYTNNLIQQRKTLKQVCDRLAIISKIELPARDPKNLWINGVWLSAIKGMDPITYAMSQGKKIAGMDPRLYAAFNGKKINGSDLNYWVRRDTQWIKQHQEDLDRYKLLLTKDFGMLLCSYYSDKTFSAENTVIQQLDKKLEQAILPALKYAPTISKWIQYVGPKQATTTPSNFSEEEIATIEQWKEDKSSEIKLSDEDMEAIENWCAHLEKASEVNLAEWGQEFIDEIKKLRKCLDYFTKAKKAFDKAKSDKTDEEKVKLFLATARIENAAEDAVAHATKDLIKQIITVVYPSPTKTQPQYLWQKTGDGWEKPDEPSPSPDLPPT